jgi:hypothetical protein
MTSKNIKKALNSKLSDWMKSVDGEEVKKLIVSNTIITGGAIVSMLTGEEVHDYDVYFRTKEAARKVAEYYVAKFNPAHKCQADVREDEKTGRIAVFIQSAGVAGEIDDESEPIVPEEVDPQEAKEPEVKAKYRTVYLSSNAITLSDKIQIVIRFYGEPEEIHKNYDFVHCTCVWTSWDNKLELPSRALEAIINKELYYMGSKYPLCSIIRSRKFISRGYTINAGQYLKMALQLNEFNLHDIEVLKDQLVGVDSAYFMAAIESIQKKQTNEPGWEIDNNYLFEVINRIF